MKVRIYYVLQEHPSAVAFLPMLDYNVLLSSRTKLPFDYVIQCSIHSNLA